MEPEACKKLIVEVSEFFQKGNALDILVNNAGMQYVASLEDLPDEKWAQVLQLNLSSCFYTTKQGNIISCYYLLTYSLILSLSIQVLPIMRANGFGRIINIASTHGIVASCNKAAYVASKHGLIGLTKVTALETATEPITCNAVCPGFVYTKLVENQIVKKANEEGKTTHLRDQVLIYLLTYLLTHTPGISVADAKINLVSEKHPSKEYVDMEDLSELVYFLTQDCAKQIRGSAYVIDGGWTAI